MAYANVPGMEGEAGDGGVWCITGEETAFPIPRRAVFRNEPLRFPGSSLLDDRGHCSPFLSVLMLR